MGEKLGDREMTQASLPLPATGSMKSFEELALEAAENH